MLLAARKSTNAALANSFWSCASGRPRARSSARLSAALRFSRAISASSARRSASSSARRRERRASSDSEAAPPAVPLGREVEVLVEAEGWSSKVDVWTDLW